MSATGAEEGAFVSGEHSPFSSFSPLLVSRRGKRRRRRRKRIWRKRRRKAHFSDPVFPENKGGIFVPPPKEGEFVLLKLFEKGGRGEERELDGDQGDGSEFRLISHKKREKKSKDFISTAAHFSVCCEFWLSSSLRVNSILSLFLLLFPWAGETDSSFASLVPLDPPLQNPVCRSKWEKRIGKIQNKRGKKKRKGLKGPRDRPTEGRKKENGHFFFFFFNSSSSSFPCIHFPERRTKGKKIRSIACKEI